MKILAANDDGIYAPGLWRLVEGVKGLGEVVVVAPDREQSGVGTSVTFHHPVRTRMVKPLVPGIEAYAIEGTPADSIILALRYLVKGEVDLLVTGINEGANLGNDVFISGTVSAALQGHFYGLPSVAISVGAIKDVQFEAASRLAGLLARHISDPSLPSDILLNVNLPNLPIPQIRGIEVTRLGSRTYSDVVQEGYDGRRKYFWIVRGKAVWDMEPGTDRWALKQDCISITPIMLNQNYPELEPALRSLAPVLFQELQATEAMPAATPPHSP